MDRRPQVRKTAVEAVDRRFVGKIAERDQRDAAVPAVRKALRFVLAAIRDVTDGAGFKQRADNYARAANIALPEDEGTVAASGPIAPVPTLDLKAANISAVIWATGYAFDFDWLKVPVLDAGGAPIQERGVTGCAHLYFLGLHWMHTFKSGVLLGVGDDAAYLADRIAARG